jgi:hypothetical protein
LASAPTYLVRDNDRAYGRVFTGRLAAMGIRDRPINPGVARLNIEHYRKLLARETDESERQMLHRLLEEEEAKLRAPGSPGQERQRLL